MGRKLEGRDAWWCLLATTLAFIMMSIPDGSFGILYDPLTHMYETSRTGIAWSLSLYWICIYLAGLLFSPVIDLYGCRVLGFVGALLYGTGITLSALTANLPGFYIAYGVINGLGCGSLYLAFSTVIQQRFTYNRGFANGVSSMGFSLGAIIHPLDTLYFMDTFGLRGTFLLHGALAYHTLIFAFALKTQKVFLQKTQNTIESEKDHKKMRDDTQVQDTMVSTSTNNAKGHKLPELCYDNYEDLNDVNNKVVNGDDERIVQVDFDANQTRHPDRSQGEPDTHPVLDQSRHMNDRGVHMDQVDDETSLTNVSKSVSMNAHTTSKEDHICCRTCKQCPKFVNMKTYLRRMIDFSLVKNAVFVLSALHFLLMWMARLSIMAQIVSCAIHRGIDKDRAAYLISISGFGNLFMRIICSVVMNFSWLDPVLFSGFGSLLVFVSGFMAAFSSSYTMFSIAMVIMGMSEAIAMANLPQLVVHLVGVSRYPRGSALIWTLMLPAPLGAAPLSGWLVDMTGAYFLAFVVIGVEGVISTILAIIVFIMTKFHGTPNDSSRNNVHTSNADCAIKV